MAATCDQCTATLPHITVDGPGRCTECSFHVETQGHRECCGGAAPVQPDKPATDSRELFDRLGAARMGYENDSGKSFCTRIDERYGRSRRPQPAGKIGNVTDVAQPGHNPAYVAAAIRADLERLAAAHEGTRNHTLHSVACNVFEFVKGGHADAGIRDELERIAAANGLPHNEVQSTLRSAWQRVEPRNVPAPKAVTPAYTIEDQTQ